MYTGLLYYSLIIIIIIIIQMSLEDISTMSTFMHLLYLPNCRLRDDTNQQITISTIKATLTTLLPYQ